MVLSASQHDLGSLVLEAGGVRSYLSRTITDSTTLRHVPQIAALCDQQRTNVTRSPDAVKADLALRSNAEHSLSDARLTLEDIRDKATNLLFEHHQRKQQLEALLDSFQQLSHARRQYLAVAKCRQIANAYIRALRPLALHQQHGSSADMHTVAANIDVLIDKVDAVRRKGSKYLFADDFHTNQRIVTSIENRAVDAVVKARAAFVNVLDNEFRHFGWPMKVPLPSTDSHIISSINFYVNQLSQLQRVANQGDYIPERTKWHRALSDSWAIAAILRAPLARFRYHFLENFDQQPSQSSSAKPPRQRTTSRFDRPEWAADFALDRIREATPFLSQVDIDGPQGADVKFAEGFCRVFAEKIAYDCELALRTSTNDADADSLIAHASETAKQFDAKLRSGVIHIHTQPDAPSSSPAFLSSLHVLSMNESFLTSWASSELRIADAQVNLLLDQALEATGEQTDDLAMSQETVAVTREQLEYLCQEIVNHVGSASQKARALESEERIATFLKLTELPLLQAIRSRLKEQVEETDYENLSVERIQRSTRASFLAHLIADGLEDRSVDAFYIAQEHRTDKCFYEDEISRLRALHSSNSTITTDAIASTFIEAVRADYADRTRFGEIPAPDAAIVLTHDLSESLVNPLISLESMLGAVNKGIPCRKSASAIWRAVATKLDAFFFYDIVLQCFAGGSRNAMAVAAEINGFLSPTHMARMARQVAHDTLMLVSTFTAVSRNPSKFLPSCSECSVVLQMAANRVLRPNASLRKEHEQVLEALERIATSDEDKAVLTTKQALETAIKVVHITPREALELCAITGLRFAIRLM
ncbi:RINT-1/Tip20 [Gracilaria domingensis]|nr:RINT-1/Tip20 [Gracilaria domingensis]